jgi:hypothetical protein
VGGGVAGVFRVDRIIKFSNSVSQDSAINSLLSAGRLLGLMDTAVNILTQIDRVRSSQSDQALCEV